MKATSNSKKSLVKSPPYFVVFLVMLYVTCKLTCNPIFFRQTEFNLPFINYYFKITCAAFIFPSIYVLSDTIVAFTNRKIAILIIIFGIICDGVFSYLVSYFSNHPLPSVISPHELLNTNAVNVIGLQMWPLFYHGVMASAIAAIGEAIIFSFFYKKINNFFISTITSIMIILVIHNLITDYPTLRAEPDVWQIIVDNWIMNTFFMIMYTLIVVMFMEFRKFFQMRFLSNK